MSLWDIVQHFQIKNLQANQILAETSQDIRHSGHRRRADGLEDDLSTLVLALDAMWSLVSERLGITPEELGARMEQMDLADGVRDGRYQAPPRRCPACDAAVGPDLRRCQFCGADAPGAHPFAR
jgi:hypothetical protein